MSIISQKLPIFLPYISRQKLLKKDVDTLDSLKVENQSIDRWLKPARIVPSVSNST